MLAQQELAGLQKRLNAISVRLCVFEMDAEPTNWITANGAHIPVGEYQKTVVERAESLPEDEAKKLIKDNLQTEAFEKWMDKPEKGTAWPLVRLPDADAEAIGAKEGVRVGKLSSDTMEKQKRPDKHPELSAAEYVDAQTVIDHPTNKAQSESNSMVYVREDESEKTGGYVLVAKVTRERDEIFMTSYRRLSRTKAKREKAIKRLMKKGGQ